MEEKKLCSENVEFQDNLEKRVLELFRECKELKVGTSRNASELILEYADLINERTPRLLLEEFNGKQERYQEGDNLIRSLHKMIAAELDSIEKKLEDIENFISTFQEIVNFLLKKIMTKLLNVAIFFPVFNIGEKLRIMDILYRLFGIVLYFRIQDNFDLVKFSRDLIMQCGQIRKSYILFLEILQYLTANFYTRKAVDMDSYLLRLDIICVESQEELSFLLLLKGLLNYYRGKMHILMDIYEQYALLPTHNYTFLNEYFCLKVSLGCFTLRDYSFSYGIIQSFKLSAKYKGKMHVAIRWQHHLAFLLLHKGNFAEARQCINEVEGLIIGSPFSAVPASFANRAKAYCCYLLNDEKKAVQIIREDSEKSFYNGKFIAPMTDPAVIGMMYDLNINKGYDLGNYSVENLIVLYLEGVSGVTRGIAYYMRSLLCKDEKEKKANLENSFNELIQTGCIYLIEKIGEAFLKVTSGEEKNFVQSQISFWRAKKNEYSDSYKIAPFNQTYACLNALLSSQNIGHNYFSIQQFLLILQKELEAQRTAFFEVDELKEVCLGTVNISSVEIEKFSLQKIRDTIAEYLKSKKQHPEYYVQDGSVGIFCIPKNSTSMYVLYLENDLKDGIFLKLKDMEKNAFSWFLYCYIRSNASRFQQNFVANSYHSTFKYQKALEPYWGEDMAPILKKVRNIAYTDIAILITGETGVGKEQLASYIHKNSRADMPFISVHLASVPLELFESELFGHEKGAFTGALKQKKGVFELAHNGTLFLDEIADVPMSMQIKLLRVLQEKKFNRVGGTEVIFSNFRLVTATNKNLVEEVAEGRFREDLYYRISMALVALPSLRERKKDFPMLVENIYSYYCMKYHKEITKIRDEDYRKLYQHSWKGNIRELVAVLEKYVVLGEIEILETDFSAKKLAEDSQNVVNNQQNINKDNLLNMKENLPEEVQENGRLLSMEELEKRYIRYVLEKTNGKIYGSGGALEILKMKKSTFYNRLEQYGIKSVNRVL